ncbi:hypothetical protein [uncultured Fusobacterium sp.]|uniref:hypothetical protein n=1 Tax=uncultured Fusobacterium sp. TaxID=159267 RepID=UPI0025FEE679|nr:hypothetical protein [uncultured Fusobacterium sp.]
MEVILVIAEGAKAESLIIDNLKKVLFNKQVIIKVIFGTSIYTFYQRKKKYGEFFEPVEILREMSEKNREILNGINRRDISSVFLFFDHDIHSSNYSKEALKEMLDFFDNEYENGKLFISYPMVEALRDISNLDEQYNQNECYYEINKYREYKAHASNVIRNISHLSVYANYNFDIWRILSRYNWIKGNLLIDQNFNLPSYDNLNRFSQKLIFDKQYELIDKTNKIIILSAFSFFIFYYFKRSFIEEKFLNKKTE